MSGRPGGAGRGGGPGRSSGAGRSDRSDGEISLVPLIAGALIGAGILAVIYFHTQKAQKSEVPEVPTVIEVTPRPRKICYRRSNVCPKISLKRRRFLTKEEEQELNRQLKEEQEKLLAEQEERKKLEEKSKSIKSFGKFFCLPENSDNKEDCDLEEESA
nr:uncharacterized protein LOC110375197 isoform X2 [Helicoverpa armigera]XP_021188902.2 uncharacterized protein LOC110375197 isoform X1 [Helicoverpa armigera]